MSATDDIRVLLGEHGVKCEIHDTKKRKDTLWDFRESSHAMFSEYRDGMTVFVMSGALWTPEQVIAATVGRGMCREVYLVETSDDLIESWYPIGVCLNSKAAEDCAEALRGEVDGIRQFARVVELKVVGE